MTTDPMIEVEGVTHRYGDRTALDAIDLSVTSACIFGLLGPNGGGKTTLFKILATLLAPTSGTARLSGFDVTTQQQAVRARLGVVFQHPSLDGKLTVMENLQHQGHLYGLRGHELRRRIERMLSRFGVADRASDRVDKLSGGLARRVELAKCMLHEPCVLLLDEPSTGLDPTARIALMRALHDVRDEHGVTCLLTTHLLDEAERCDRLALLDAGRLVAEGAPSELRERVGGDVVTIRCDSPLEVAARLREQMGLDADVVDGHVRVEHHDGAELVPRISAELGRDVHSVTVGRPTLEDAFIHLTGHALGGDEKSKHEATQAGGNSE